MKKLEIKTSLFLTLAGMLMSIGIWAQSPAATATGKAGGATITVTYSSPSVKGRKIFGGLVPYDKVWRAGANQVTTIVTDNVVKVGGKDLPAGKYSLYIIPSEKDWTFIINSQTGQWGIKKDGSTTRDPAKDIITVMATPAKTASLVESMVYVINDKGLSLKWENTEVLMAITEDSRNKK